MTMIDTRKSLAIALGVTALAASCAELPDTQLKNKAGASGSATNAGGTPGGGGRANAGSGGKPVSTPGAGGADESSGATGGSAGSAVAGKGSSGAGTGTAGHTPATGGAAGNTTGNSGEGPGGASNGGDGSSGGGRTYSTNRSDFFGDTRCDQAQVALCEDFETGKLDTKRWATQGGAPTIETVRAARGMYSAHFHTADNGLSLIRQTATFPAPNNTYFARVFVWFDSMPTAPDWAHWTVSGAQNTDDPFEVRVGGQFDPFESKNLFGVGTDHGVTGDWTNLDQDNGMKPVPVQSWVCLEWMHKGDTNETKFWWDGVEHPSLATTATMHGGTSDPYTLPDFDSMWVGWWLYQSGTNPDHFDVWLDEVAVDYTRIGCDK